MELNMSSEQLAQAGSQSGVYRNEDGCLVTLTRAVALSSLDGLLLGWDPCHVRPFVFQKGDLYCRTAPLGTAWSPHRTLTGEL